MEQVTKSIAVYVRTSTTDQNTEGQRDELTKWVKGNGMDLAAAEFYVDQDSGTKISRKHFDRMQKDVENGKIRTIIVWKFDRIGRSMLDGMNIVARWGEKNIRVVSTTQQVDISGTMGKIMFAVLMGFSQLETEYRKERQKVGIARGKKNGVYKGRKPGTLKGNPKRAIELKAKGLDVGEIATAMGIKTRSVYRYLNRAD